MDINRRLWDQEKLPAIVVIHSDFFARLAKRLKVHAFREGPHH